MGSLWRTAVRFAAVASAAAIGLTISPAASAVAEAGRCSLTWKQRYGENLVNFTLDCPPKNPGDVLWKINIWADDLFDDDLIEVYPLNCVPTKKIKWSMHENDLNEDGADRDEVYAGVWFRRADGSTYGIQSTVAAGWWGTILPAKKPLPTLPDC